MTQTDDRGKPTTIIDPVAMYLWKPVTSRLSNRAHTIPPDQLFAIADDLDSRWTRRGHLFFAIYIGGLLIIYTLSYYYRNYISSTNTMGPIDYGFHIIQFVFLIGTFLLSWHIGKRSRKPRIRRTMLKHERCPHCGYSLHGLTPDPTDNAKICPECGHAWITAPHHEPSTIPKA